MQIPVIGGVGRGDGRGGCSLGDREVEEGKVAVRERSKGDIGAMSLEEFKQMAQRLVETRALTND